jgi:hypothetical protein
MSNEKFTVNFYYILNCENDTIYIGSTNNDIKKRYEQHRRSYINYLKTKKGYYSICDLFEQCNDITNININLIKSVDCYNKLDKLKIENEIIDTYKKDKKYKVVNKNKAYDSDNFEFRKAYRDVYKYGGKCKSIIEIDGKLYKISISPVEVQI